MTGKFAAKTDVSVSASKAEIERLVERYGASGFMSGWKAEIAVIAFSMQDRQVRFTLSMPSRDDEQFTTYMRGSVPHRREPDSAHKLWEQACRQKWRALALVVKAKLEAVESGISTFEDEFMASIVMPNGRTVSEEIIPKIAAAYETGAVQPLLPGY
jgi:hypothetical protein